MSSAKSHIESDIGHIKQIMELASQHKILPDWAAIIGGTLVLLATLITWLFTRSGDIKAVYFLDTLPNMIIGGIWVGVAGLSIFLYYILALKEAKRLGVSVKSKPTQMARLAMGPSILAASIISLGLIYYEFLAFVPGVWILLYGVGLYNASLFSTREPRILSILFISTGFISILLLPELDLWLTSLSFGGYHIGFGFYVLKYKR